MPLLLVGIFFTEKRALEISILFVCIVLAANSFTSQFLLPWAMLPNVLDEYLLKYGNKLDALFYTMFALLVKVLIAIYAGIVQLVLRLRSHV